MNITNGSALLNPKATELSIGGLAPLSTCDWPGELAATVFCQGCAWDCPYCQNPGLRPAGAKEQLSWVSVIEFLSGRRGLLDAVVFSGGEPTIQPALLDAVREVRALGFRVGLHTSGMAPEAFAALLPLLDWVGFDVKAPFAAYPHITGVRGSGDKARASLRNLLASGVLYEVRTTVHTKLLSSADMMELRSQLLDLGVENFFVQQFRTQGVFPGRLPHSDGKLPIPSHYGKGFLHFEVR